jgi:hypothetical protein
MVGCTASLTFPFGMGNSARTPLDAMDWRQRNPPTQRVSSTSLELLPSNNSVAVFSMCSWLEWTLVPFAIGWLASRSGPGVALHQGHALQLPLLQLYTTHSYLESAVCSCDLEVQTAIWLPVTRATMRTKLLRLLVSCGACQPQISGWKFLFSFRPAQTIVR